MATNAASAAARRRRIAERGSERLALITGRVPSISSSSPPVHHSSTAPSLPSVFPSSDQLPFSDENTDSPLNTETAGEDVQPVNPNPEKTTETSAQESVTPDNTRSFPFPTTLTEHNPPSISTTNQLPKSEYLHQTLTPNQLRPAITASQDIRRNCSVITAVLVLLSYAGFPVLGSNIIKSIILLRPLILLLLTNITIVVAPLLLEKVKQKEQRTANQFSMALEWGMLMKTGLSSLFMDCSIYSVILVCGMSFLQKLGW